MMTSAAIQQEHKTEYEPIKVDKPKIDQLDSYMDAPWRDKNIVHEDENVVVYEDGYPVTEGHLLFVPKKTQRQLDITRCFELAYKWGVRGVCDYKWEAFNVGINNGVEAGQSVMWPHVHMIPRREGDTPNPRGGVRNVIPLKGDYKVGIGWGLAKGVAAKRVDDHWKERYEGYREWKEKLPE
jgi:diadenosine tetraphosphate (Ap4A) HIT family hydrolase